MGLDWMGQDRTGLERLFFPPSQKCGGGTSKGLDWMRWERIGMDRTGLDWTGLVFFKTQTRKGKQCKH